MRKLWIAFAAVVILSFAVLGWVGVQIYQEAPPIPERVVTTDGREVIEPGEIQDGQNVWQSLGGMEVGLDLGARQLRRSRLDRRLAAPRGDVHPRPLGDGEFGATTTTLTGRTAGATSGPAAAADADRTRYDPATRHDHHRPGAGRGVRGQPRALLGRVRQRASRVRHPGGRA